MAIATTTIASSARSFSCSFLWCCTSFCAINASSSPFSFVSTSFSSLSYLKLSANSLSSSVVNRRAVPPSMTRQPPSVVCSNFRLPDLVFGAICRCLLVTLSSAFASPSFVLSPRSVSVSVERGRLRGDQSRPVRFVPLLTCPIPLLTSRLDSCLPGASLQLYFETVLKWPEIAPFIVTLGDTPSSLA
jgi:hypothetical protein